MAAQEEDFDYPYPYNIPVAFYFKVKITGLDADIDCAFEEVTGINVSLETDSVKEGGVLDYSHILPIRAKYDNLTLKRGYLKGSSFFNWINNAVRYFIFDPKIIHVSLMDAKGVDLVKWTFSNAYPVSYKISEFKAQDNNKLVIESLEIAYNYFERVDV